MSIFKASLPLTLLLASITSSSYDLENKGKVIDSGPFNDPGNEVIEPRDWPCVNNGDISPCRCVSGGIMVIDLWCSGLTGDEQLATIFQARFPYRHYRSIHLEDSPGITGLPSGIFGNLTFAQFHVVNGAMDYVDAGALSLSHEYAEMMNFYYHQLTSFPFEDLPSFLNLRELRLYGNKLSGLPSLSSQSLEVLSLGYNPLGATLTDTTFANTPALREIHLYGAQITEVMSGTFAGLINLTFVSLRDNQVSFLPEGSVVMAGLHGSRVYLQNNTITTIEPNAITGMKGGLVDVHSNHITTLDEVVWGGLLRDGVFVDLRDNPLTCGCDVAWVVNGGVTLLDLIDKDTTCQDGQLLHDLDPALFENC